MKAFVTGATGFIGTHLVRALLARGHTVTSLIRTPAKARGPEWQAVRMIRGDLDDTAALREGCRDADVVFHVAGAVAARGAAGFMSVNRDATAKVLEATQEHSPRRFVYVSSQAAGGPNRRGQAIDESHPAAPVTHYGRSKLAAEMLVRASPLPWTIVRPAVVYGERDRELLKAFKIVRLGVMPVFGDGRQELSAIYAGDLAEALIAVALADATAGRLYYAAHPQPTTSGALVHAIGQAMGATVRVVPLPAVVARTVLTVVGGVAALRGRATVVSPDKAAEFFAPAWTCRPDALARDAGWHARTPLDAGLRRTAEWYRTAGWL